MADQTPSPKPLRTIESPQAPDVFASWLLGASRRMGNLHMTFVSDRFTHTTNEPTHVVIGRLVMPLEGVEDMTRFLIKYLRSNGIDVTEDRKTERPPGAPTLQ